MIHTLLLRNGRSHILAMLCSAVLLPLCSGFAQAQESANDSNGAQEQPNFFTLKKDFERRWAEVQSKRKELMEAQKREALLQGRPYTEAISKAGYKTFKRWEWYWGTRVNADGSFPSPEQYEREWQKYVQQRTNSTLVRDMVGTQTKRENPLNIWTNWQHLGPFGAPTPLNSGGVGGAGIGRVTCVAFGGSEDTIYVGTPASGLWRTYNRGQSWAPQSTELPPHGVRSIAVDPRGNGRVFMGTSNISVEAVTNGGIARNSLGIYRSTDKGSTWTNVSAGISGGVGNINRIRIHPTGPDTVFAATSQGIWRSDNGGIAWYNVAGGNIADLEFHPTDASIIYATSFRNGSAMPARIWRSTTGGSSGSFSQIMTGVATAFARIELAVSPDKPNWVYAMCSDSTNVSFSAMYRTTTTGDSWSAIVPQGSLSNLLGTQAFANFVLAVAPGDGNVVCAGGLDFWRSDNGGGTATWNKKTAWNNAGGSDYLHADQWDVVYPPGSTGSVVYIGNDGGISRSTNWGTTWTPINGNMSTMTLYRLSIDQNHDAMTMVGAQDNGSSRYWPYVNGDWHPTWNKVFGGDGMESLVSPNSNNDNVYTMVQNGKLYKSSSWGSSYSENTPSGQLDGNGDGKGYWVTPMVYVPSYSCVLTGYNRVYAYKDNDPNIPEVGHRTASAAFPNANELATVIAVSSDGGTMYAATINSTNNTFQVYRGTISTVYYTPPMSAVTFSFPYVYSWTLLTGGPGTTPVASIATHPTDPDVVYVSCGRNGGVFKSVNKGRTWSAITGGLPQVPVNSIVVEHDANQPNREGLYIGTDFGVYYRDNAMGDWDVFDIGNGFGLSNSPVMELEIHKNKKELRAATFGRGLYKTSLFTPSQFAKYYPVSFGRNSDSYWINNIQLWSAEGVEQNTSGDNNGYLDATRSTTLNLQVFTGGSHLLQITRGIATGASTAPAMRYRVWIDINRDGTFDDAGELVGSSDGTAGTATTSMWLSIPDPAWYVGITRMRIAMCIGGTPSHNAPFTTGEVEDYTIEVRDCINFGGVLSAYPVASSSASIVWSGSATSDYEVRYRVKNTQTWTVSNAAYQPYAAYPNLFQCDLANLTANTQYEVQVRATCGATVWGGVSTTWLPSPAFVIRTIPSSAPYCASFAMPMQGGVGDNETYIENVKISRGLTMLLNHTSGNDFGYQKFGYSGWGFPVATLPVGVQLGIGLTAVEITPPDFNDLHRRWKIWIDLNNDTVFSANELLYDSQISTTSLSKSGTMTIPLSGTTLGITRMRVSMKGVHTGINDSASAGPCEVLPYGEVQDYKIMLSNPNARPIATGVDERGEAMLLQLAPNPATNELLVQYQCTAYETATVEIVDVVGRVVQSLHVPCAEGGNSFTLPLHTLANGVYTLRIHNDNAVLTRMFTIAR